MKQKDFREEEMQAREYTGQGDNFEQQGLLQNAERAYLRAMRIYDRLLAETGEKEYARLARDLCEGLADLCMQQGNMHGADVYYVKMMTYVLQDPDDAE